MATINNEVNTQLRVFNLYCELLEAKKNKKSVMKECAEDIKRIESEIEDLIDEDEDQAPAVVTT